MIRLWISAAIISLALADTAPGSPPAEGPREASSKQEEALRKTRQLLAEIISIEPMEMPLAKLLAALEKQLPEAKKVSLRIDVHAFGKDANKILEAPIRLPRMKKVSLWTVVRLALRQVAFPTDYRFGADEALITTPAAALYTAVHPIRDLVENPAFEPTQGLGVSLKPFDPLSNRKPDEKAAAVVRLIVSTIDSESWYPTTDSHGTIQVLNGTQLVIHANANRHEQVAELLESKTGLRVETEEAFVAVFDGAEKMREPMLWTQQGRILADVSRQRWTSAWAPVARFYYEDKPFRYADCGSSEVWKAKQQQWWYEVAGGVLESEAIRCRRCRRAKRVRDRKQRPNSSEE
jgi:hypothetical protein